MSDVAAAHAAFTRLVTGHKPHIIRHGYADADDYAELSRTTGQIADAVRVYFRAVIADAIDNSEIKPSFMHAVKEVHLELDLMYEGITSLFDQAAELYREMEEEDE